MLLCGIASHATAKSKAKMKLVTAYSRYIPEAEQTSPAMLGQFIVVRWEHTSYPETVFWRGENGWLSCRIEKAHKTTVKGKVSYVGIETDIATIHKGDTLLLTPVTGGRFPIPAEIPEKAKNTVFYKTAGSGWLAFPVKKIEKK